MPLDYPYPREDEQGVDLHYKPFRLLRLTSSSLAIQSLVRAIIFYLASNPRSGASYLYDHGGRLVEVRGVQAVRRYDYESTYLMKVEENGQRVAEFDYDRQGRISDLKLPDGRLCKFRYEYDRADTNRIVRAILTAPDGSIAKFDIPPN